MAACFITMDRCHSRRRLCAFPSCSTLRPESASEPRSRHAGWCSRWSRPAQFRAAPAVRCPDAPTLRWLPAYNA